MLTANIIQLRSAKAQREHTDAERLRARMGWHLAWPRCRSMAEAKRLAAQELKLSHMVNED